MCPAPASRRRASSPHPSFPAPRRRRADGRRPRSPIRAPLVASALLAVVLGAAVLLPAAAGADFPPITAEERAFGSPDDGVPAVVLFEKADLRLGSPSLDQWSELEVWRRIKVLTDEGVSSFSDIAVAHNRRMRLRSIEARTVLPDGREVAVTDESTFRQEVSRALGRRVTKVAMPAVQVGAILDLHYVLTWPDFSYLSPWIFDHSVPTLLSEFTYHKPDNLALQQWWLETAGIPMQKEERRTVHGAATRVWMERLPPLPDEPFSFPAGDLANRFMVIPQAFVSSGQSYPVFESWERVSDFAEDAYRKLTRGSELKRRARQIAAAEDDDRARVTALFRFVRDQIRTDTTRHPLTVSGPDAPGEADRVLTAGLGSAVEKTLLLVGMLRAAKLDAWPVWTANRLGGRIDVQVPNPSWFDWPMAAVEIDGDLVFLDPSDPGLTDGQVAPFYEGMPALLLDDRKSRIVEVPFSSASSNRRTARVELTVDDDGRLVGDGRLELAGGPAWEHLDGDDSDLVEDWTQELRQAWPGFDVEQVLALAAVDAGELRITWSLRQRDEEVFGDEVTLFPSRPWIHGQPFTLAPEERLTPVQFRYAARDEVETVVRWPAGWNLELEPRSADVEGPAGHYRASCTVDAAARSAVCRRSFERAQAEYLGRPAYTMLRRLHETASQVDREGLVLVRP